MLNLEFSKPLPSRTASKGHEALVSAYRTARGGLSSLSADLPLHERVSRVSRFAVLSNLLHRVESVYDSCRFTAFDVDGDEEDCRLSPSQSDPISGIDLPLVGNPRVAVDLLREVTPGSSDVVVFQPTGLPLHFLYEYGELTTVLVDGTLPDNLIGTVEDLLTTYGLVYLDGAANHETCRLSAALYKTADFDLVFTDLVYPVNASSPLGYRLNELLYTSLPVVDMLELGDLLSDESALPDVVSDLVGMREAELPYPFYGVVVSDGTKSTLFLLEDLAPAEKFEVSQVEMLPLGFSRVPVGASFNGDTRKWLPFFDWLAFSETFKAPYVAVPYAKVQVGVVPLRVVLTGIGQPYLSDAAVPLLLEYVSQPLPDKVV